MNLYNTKVKRNLFVFTGDTNTIDLHFKKILTSIFFYLKKEVDIIELPPIPRSIEILIPEDKSKWSPIYEFAWMKINLGDWEIYKDYCGQYYSYVLNVQRAAIIVSDSLKSYYHIDTEGNICEESDCGANPLISFQTINDYDVWRCFQGTNSPYNISKKCFDLIQDLKCTVQTSLDEIKCVKTNLKKQTKSSKSEKENWVQEKKELLQEKKIWEKEKEEMVKKEKNLQQKYNVLLYSLKHEKMKKEKIKSCNTQHDLKIQDLKIQENMEFLQNKLQQVEKENEVLRSAQNEKENIEVEKVEKRRLTDLLADKNKKIDAINNKFLKEKSISKKLKQQSSLLCRKMEKVENENEKLRAEFSSLRTENAILKIAKKNAENGQLVLTLKDEIKELRKEMKKIEDSVKTLYKLSFNSDEDVGTILALAQITNSLQVQYQLLCAIAKNQFTKQNIIDMAQKNIARNGDKETPLCISNIHDLVVRIMYEFYKKEKNFRMLFDFNHLKMSRVQEQNVNYQKQICELMRFQNSVKDLFSVFILDHKPENLIYFMLNMPFGAAGVSFKETVFEDIFLPLDRIRNILKLKTYRCLSAIRIQRFMRRHNYTPFKKHAKCIKFHMEKILEKTYKYLTQDVALDRVVRLSTIVHHHKSFLNLQEDIVFDKIGNKHNILTCSICLRKKDCSFFYRNTSKLFCRTCFEGKILKKKGKEVVILGHKHFLEKELFLKNTFDFFKNVSQHSKRYKLLHLLEDAKQKRLNDLLFRFIPIFPKTWHKRIFCGMLITGDEKNVQTLGRWKENEEESVTEREMTNLNLFLKKHFDSLNANKKDDILALEKNIAKAFGIPEYDVCRLLCKWYQEHLIPCTEKKTDGKMDLSKTNVSDLKSDASSFKIQNAQQWIDKNSEDFKEFLHKINKNFLGGNKDMAQSIENLVIKN